ncbi:hypothetical protein FHD45_12695 [Escherichia coli]|nr:hypothetical protein [Escherichia coli]
MRYATYKTCTLALCRPDKAPVSHLAYTKRTLLVCSPHPNPLPGGARGLSGHIFRLCHQSEPAIGRLWCSFTLPC